MRVRFDRVKVLRKKKRYQEAINDLKYILRKGKSSGKYSVETEIEQYAFRELFYMCYYLNKYDEVLQLLPSAYETGCIKRYSASICELVIKLSLNMDIKVKKDVKLEYLRSQIFNYSSSRALNHIQEHLTDDGIEHHTYFREGIDLEYLLQVVRSNLKNYERADVNDVLQIHFLSVPNIGTSDLGPCSFIKVVSVPNTDSVISIYPQLHQEYENIQCLDCDYDKLFKKEKVKTMSQIDKFNKRFKRV